MRISLPITYTWTYLKCLYSIIHIILHVPLFEFSFIWLVFFLLATQFYIEEIIWKESVWVLKLLILFILITHDSLPSTCNSDQNRKYNIYRQHYDYYNDNNNRMKWKNKYRKVIINTVRNSRLINKWSRDTRLILKKKISYWILFQLVNEFSFLIIPKVAELKRREHPYPQV